MPRKTKEKVEENEEENLLTFPLSEDLREKFQIKLSQYQQLYQETNKIFNKLYDNHSKYILLPPHHRHNLIPLMKGYKSDIKNYSKVINYIQKNLNDSSNVSEKDLYYLDLDIESSLRHLESYLNLVLKNCDLPPLV